MKKSTSGSIIKKNGWLCIVINYYDTTGKRKQYYKNTHLSPRGNLKQAKLMLADEIKRLQEQIHNQEKEIELAKKSQKELTFIEMLKKYIDYKEMQGKVRSLTIHEMKGYLKLISQYLESIGKINILANDIDEEFLNHYYSTYLKNRQGHNGQKITSNTIRHYQMFINPAFAWAFRKSLILNNPAKDIDYVEAKFKRVEGLNPSEVDKLIEECEKNSLAFLIKLTLIYGFRREEVLGLKWSTIDFETQTIKLEETVKRKNKKFIIDDEFKNNESKTILPFLNNAEDILIAKKLDIEKNKKILCNYYNTEYLDFVCVDEYGELYKPDRISKYTSRMAKQANIRHVHFHQLRHTTAKTLLLNGASLKEVQELLRHKSYDTTVKYYIHFTIEEKKAIGNYLNNVWSFTKKNKENE